MQVRMKIGPKTGELVDLPYAAARHLVEMDQAEDVNDQMRLPKAKVTRIDDVVVGVDLSAKSDTTAQAVHKKKRK